MHFFRTIKSWKKVDREFWLMLGKFRGGFLAKVSGKSNQIFEAVKPTPFVSVGLLKIDFVRGCISSVLALLKGWGYTRKQGLRGFLFLKRKTG